MGWWASRLALNKERFIVDLVRAGQSGIDGVLVVWVGAVVGTPDIPEWRIEAIRALVCPDLMGSALGHAFGADSNVVLSAVKTILCDARLDERARCELIRIAVAEEGCA